MGKGKRKKRGKRERKGKGKEGGKAARERAKGDQS